MADSRAHTDFRALSTLLACEDEADEHTDLNSRLLSHKAILVRTLGTSRPERDNHYTMSVVTMVSHWILSSG